MRKFWNRRTLIFLAWPAALLVFLNIFFPPSDLENTKRWLFIEQKLNGPESALVARRYYHLGMIYIGSEKWELAEPAFEQAATIYKKTRGANSPQALVSLYGLGYSQMYLEKYEDAEKTLKLVYDRLNLLDDHGRRMSDTIACLKRIYEQQNKELPAYLKVYRPTVL